MANQKHVELLKQGVEQWNEWRKQHPEIRPDLSEVNLVKANLSGIDLSGADLRHADLYSADLSSANLSGADFRSAALIAAHLNYAILRGANLCSVILADADLRFADLSHADLRGIILADADLSGADLPDVDLSHANLNNTSLSGADLSGAVLHDADLSSADLSYADLSLTIIAGVDLRTTQGLAAINHQGPSIVQLHTVQLPQDGSALHFLRGIGIPDEWIDFWRSTMIHPIQYHSCFISYSSEDNILVRRLHADLQAQGVGCWFAPHDMKIGAKIRPTIDQAIHIHEKLLLLLSEHSIESDWVEDEVEAAIEKEQRQHREVLFPVRLDESVLQTTQAWAAKLRRSRHIGDFTNWTDPQKYGQAFERLLRDLKRANE